MGRQTDCPRDRDQPQHGEGLHRGGRLDAVSTTAAQEGARRPRPYRARTKGKTENGVGYVKRNAIAGRCFPSWEAFEAHLEAWTRDVADVRVHGTTGEAPIDRFQHAEAQALKPIAGIPPFQAVRELVRRVQSDCAVEIDGNAYSVPWRLIGEMVRATIMDSTVRVYHGPHEVAVHPICAGCRRRVIDPAHFARTDRLQTEPRE